MQKKYRSKVLRAEPGRSTSPANHRHHQLSRILVHLRDELHVQNPRLAKPTTAMIEHLVFNCPLSLLEGEDWQKVIYQVLCYLEVQMSPTNEDTHHFIRSDRDQPLFPNEELFDEYDAFLFAKGLLHLQKQNLGGIT